MDNDQKIGNFIISILNIATYEKEITRTTRFINLNIDSIAFIEVILNIENEFNITFDNDKLVISAYKTTDDLVKYVMSKKSNICREE